MGANNDKESPSDLRSDRYRQKFSSDSEYETDNPNRSDKDRRDRGAGERERKILADLFPELKICQGTDRIEIPFEWVEHDRQLTREEKTVIGSVELTFVDRFEALKKKRLE